MSSISRATRNDNIFEVIAPASPIGIVDRIKGGIVVARFVFRLLGDKAQYEKLARLSVLREEPLEKTLLHVLKSGFRLIPTNVDRLDLPGEKDVVASVKRVSERTFEITTDDGMTFHDWEGSRKHTSLYWLTRDKSKKIYSADSFFAAAAVNRSYVHGIGRFPGDEYLPGSGGTVIEAGAYVGYKAIRFAQQVAPTGTVIIIEASPENFALLQKNIQMNNLESVAKPLNCAIWKADGPITLMSKGRMQHTVAETEELKFDKDEQIDSKTLDTLIDEQGLESVDYLNLQLNGAEIEAIDGLQRNFDKVRYINLITRYSREGELVVDTARRMLEARGCEIVVDSRSGSLFNLTAKVVPGGNE